MKKQILVCVDLKELSRRVVEKAVEVGKEMNGEIHLIHVRDASPTSSHATPNHSRRSAQEMIRENNELEKLEETLRDSGLTYKAEQPTGDVVKVLTNKIKELTPTMLVLGSAHNTALHHVVSGSIAGTLLDKTGVSVLLVPEKK